LCILDFSDPSIRALKWAIEVASIYHYHLSIVHPYRLQSVSQNEDVFQVKKNKEDTAALRFAELEKELLNGKGIPFDFRSEVGFLRDRVEDRVKRNSTLLVVVGKGMNSIAKENYDELIGSVTVPLVIIP
jgi:nucleotide-binding universal stress UspA family protein